MVSDIDSECYAQIDKTLHIADIADWGGNQHGIKQRLLKNNTPSEVGQATMRAIERLDSPGDALKGMLAIRQWGLSYSSKTLRCVCPQSYPALDQKIREAIGVNVLPRIYDGHVSSMIRGYLKFIGICGQIRSQVKSDGPRSGHEWYLADVEMAMFQFVWEGGTLTS